MLRHLQIHDLVIVERLELELAPGMSALTGETGAGKSILIDALGLVLGAQADKAMIRAGAERAEVSALFDLDALPQAAAWLAERGLEAEGECVLRRVLVREGRSRAFINGRPATRQLLLELGERLVQIHGQHEHQRLLKSGEQRRLLDAWGGHQKLLQEVAQHHGHWRALDERLERLQRQADDGRRRLDYLAFQIEELRRLAPEADEVESLIEEQKRLANADRLGSELGALVHRLLESDPSLQEELGRLARETETLATELLQEAAPAAELLDSARIQVEEAGALLRDLAVGVEHDPARLAEVERRLGALHDAARKHRVPVEALPQRLAELEAEYQTLDDAEATIETLEKERAEAWQAYLTACGKLRRRRQGAAKRLSRLLTQSMQELAMEGGRFDIEIGERAPEKAARHGLDEVSFLVSANPGQPLAPLAKVASGGELSRLSLAIQVATAHLGEVPTLIFDEVDVGIGGAVAEKVGRLLRQLGEQRQVLCVTHLPQVAGQAHHHYRVRKQRKKNRTYTTIEPLDQAARIEEIARMVGGSRITAESRRHARQLIAEQSSP